MTMSIASYVMVPRQDYWKLSDPTEPIDLKVVEPGEE
jgi:hypothetical protein